MLTHGKKFLIHVWEDVGLKPAEILAIFTASLIMGVIVLVPLLGLGWLLSRAMERSLEDSVVAIIGLAFLVLGIICLIQRFRQTWKDSA